MPFLGFRWVVNFVLLAVPIGATLGILIGIDAGRSSNGQSPIFTEPDNPGTTPKNNGITAMVSCDKAMGLHPLSKGQEYTRKSSPSHQSFAMSSSSPVSFTGTCLSVTCGGTDRTPRCSQASPVADALRAVCLYVI